MMRPIGYVVQKLPEYQVVHFSPSKSAAEAFIAQNGIQGRVKQTFIQSALDDYPTDTKQVIELYEPNEQGLLVATQTTNKEISP